MTVRELIDRLECFDDDTKVVIGMKQKYGSDFAMNISIEYDVDEYGIRAYYGDDYKAVVITEGSQIGVVDYEGYYDDNEDFEDEE